MVTETLAGGSGASRFGPGVNTVSTDISNTMNQPAEAMEMDAPVRVYRLAVRRGSGGAGQHVGGCGVQRDYEVLRGPADADLPRGTPCACGARAGGRRTRRHGGGVYPAPGRHAGG